MIYDNYNRMNVKDKLSIELGREATIDETFEKLNVSREEVGMISKLFMSPLCLDVTVESDEGELDLTWNFHILSNFIADSNIDVAEEAIDPEYRKYLENVFSEYLTKRELEILKYKVGLNFPCLSGEDIALLLGMSQQRVSQLWIKGVKKLAKVPNITNIIMK